MGKGVDGRRRLAIVVFVYIALLFFANYGYGLAHEAAHAAVIEALGGQVCGIYVNAFGTDAYTGHTPVAGAANLVLVSAAGLAMTTLLALAFAAANQGLLATFLAARSAIYALNYSPGTDISTIHAVAGSLSVALSLIIVSINLICICAVIKGLRTPAALALKRLTVGLSSSLSRARPAHNN